MRVLNCASVIARSACAAVESATSLRPLAGFLGLVLGSARFFPPFFFAVSAFFSTFSRLRFSRLMMSTTCGPASASRGRWRPADGSGLGLFFNDLQDGFLVSILILLGLNGAAIASTRR